MDIASAPGTQQRHLAKSYLARVMAEAGDVGSIRAGDNSCIHRRAYDAGRELALSPG